MIKKEHFNEDLDGSICRSFFQKLLKIILCGKNMKLRQKKILDVACMIRKLELV